MVDFTIYGKTYPLANNLRAQQKLEELFGSMQAFQDTFRTLENDIQFIEFVSKAGAAMMMGAEMQERRRCEIFGTEYKGEVALTAEALMDILDGNSAGELFKCVMDAIHEGDKRTVEVKDSKNAKATPSK